MALPIEILDLLEDMRALLQDASDDLEGTTPIGEVNVESALEHIESALTRLTEVETRREIRASRARGGCIRCHGRLDGYRGYPYVKGEESGKVCDECAEALGLFRECGHESPYIDNCFVCAPRWNKIPVPHAGEILDDLVRYELLHDGMIG